MMVEPSNLFLGSFSVKHAKNIHMCCRALYKLAKKVPKQRRHLTFPLCHTCSRGLHLNRATESYLFLSVSFPRTSVVISHLFLPSFDSIDNLLFSEEKVFITER